MLATSNNSFAIDNGTRSIPRQHSPGSRYRADVDGLRAVAVIAVLAFHAGISWLPGGFVGVDVFFVISGWLITSQIALAVDSGTFSTIEFYKRRIVRILPALCAMLLTVLAWGYYNLYPDEFTKLAKEVVATCLSGANIYFFWHTGYFDGANDVNPVLHTWSLGVEEQFYIFFPLILMVIQRFCPRRRTAILLSLLLISLFWSIALTRLNPNAAFYLPDSRTWELLVGSLLAVMPKAGIKWKPRPETLTAIGLLLIILPCCLFNHATPFPGPTALVPCAGAAIIILAGSSGTSKLRHILTFRPVVLLGKISYSLYLWHMPLIVMQRVSRIVDTGYSPIVDRTIVVMATFPIAFASWWFIERPFRAESKSFPRARRAMTALTGMGLALVIALAIWHYDGIPKRFSPQANKLASFLGYDASSDFRSGECFLYDRFTFADFNQKSCMATSSGKKTYLIIGDSHAAHLYQGLVGVFGVTHNIIQATATGCKPVLNDRTGDSACAEMNRYIFDRYLPTHRVDLLIISARWATDDLPRLNQTLEWLKDNHQPAAVVGPTMEFDEQLPRILATVEDHPNRGKELPSHLIKSYKKLNEQMKQIVQSSGATFVNAYQLLCPDGCVYLSNGEPLMFDKGHLTKSGSLLLARRLQQSGELLEVGK